MRRHTNLPYTYRPGLTVDDPRYQGRVWCDIEQLRQTGGSAESIARLECILGRDTEGCDSFEIEAWRATDGQTLYISKWLTPDPEHVIVYFNGLESHAGWFSDVARVLAQHGVTVYAIDRRGSGLNTRAAGTCCDWIDDAARSIALVRKAWPRANVHALSLCFGAAVASGLAIERPRALDSLIYLSPGLCLQVHPNRREMLRTAWGQVCGLACNVPSPIRFDEMFTESAQALWFLYRDKLRTVGPRARDFWEARRILQYVHRHLAQVKIRAAVFLAGRDRIVDNGATRETFQNLGRPPQIVEYPDSDHIIFWGPAREQLVADILNFVA